MIFQDPMTAMNPVYQVGDQIVEQIRAHRDIGKAQARDQAIELLKAVGIPGAEERVDAFPHEFSGGMRQRAMIAMGLSLEPELLIADEPTTALDVTIQAQILRLLKKLNAERNLAVIMITHDLGVVADIADRVLVMYGGRVVESGTLEQIFYDPQHPYTWGLLGSVMRLDRPRDGAARPDQGPAAVADLAARGLPLPPPLPARVRPLHREAAARGPRRRPPRPLLALRPSRRRRSGCSRSATSASRRRPRDGQRRPIRVAHGVAGRRLGGPAARGHRRREALPDQVGDPDRPPDRRRPGRRRRLVHGRRGRDARPRRRVGLREVDARAVDPAAAAPDGGLGPLSRHRADRAQPATDAAAAPRDADDLPGPLRVAQPAQAGRPDRRRAAEAPRHRLREQS